MRILLDQNIPAPLRHILPGHQVETAYDRGWAELLNRDLISQAESTGCDLLITSDQGIPYQQNWAGRSLALTVLSTNDWNRIRRFKDGVLAAVNAIKQSECVNLDVPRDECGGPLYHSG
jgi:predicted nuclease of predicted toxin-antitoxin system